MADKRFKAKNGLDANSLTVENVADGVNPNAAVNRNQLDGKFDIPETVVTVEQYGAIGDGVTDDTVAIQNALDSSATTIFLKSGTWYKITSKLTMTGKTLSNIGGTARAALIRTTAIDMLEVVNSGVVSGINFVGGALSVTDTNNTKSLLSIKKTIRNENKETIITDCKFTDSYSTGILVDNYAYDMGAEFRSTLTIDRCTFQNIYCPAVVLYKTTYIKVVNNEFRYCYTGVCCDGSANILISDNIMAKVGNTAYVNYFNGVNVGGKGCGIIVASTVSGNNSGKMNVFNNVANHLRGRFLEAYQVESLNGVTTPINLNGNTLLSYMDDLNSNVKPEKILLYGKVSAFVSGNLIEGQVASDIKMTSYSTFYPVLVLTNNAWADVSVRISADVNSKYTANNNTLIVEGVSSGRDSDTGGWNIGGTIASTATAAQIIAVASKNGVTNVAAVPECPVGSLPTSTASLSTTDSIAVALGKFNTILNRKIDSISIPASTVPDSSTWGEGWSMYEGVTGWVDRVYGFKYGGNDHLQFGFASATDGALQYRHNVGSAWGTTRTVWDTVNLPYPAPISVAIDFGDAYTTAVDTPFFRGGADVNPTAYTVPFAGTIYSVSANWDVAPATAYKIRYRKNGGSWTDFSTVTIAGGTANTYQLPSTAISFIAGDYFEFSCNVSGTSGAFSVLFKQS